MNSELQKRLYEIEVTPPVEVWERLSVTIDEINGDKPVSNRILDAQAAPPAGAWENISAAIGEKKKATVIGFRRLAVAAIFIGVIITAWLLFKSQNRQSTELAGTKDPAPVEKTGTDTNSVEKKSDARNLNELPMPAAPLAETTSSSATSERKNKTYRARNNDIPSSQVATPQYAVLNTEAPLGKNFDKPIDDLSLVTADQNYLTMVNANGRLVKIPAQLASLAPHLQDKPVAEDIYEVMFGEGAYWKETLNEWRKKVASSPVSSGDAFNSFIELLKTVQDK